jgi:hypothetical protein
MSSIAQPTAAAVAADVAARTAAAVSGDSDNGFGWG